MPSSGALKVSTRKVVVLVASRAALISSLRTISAPFPWRPARSPSRTALSRLSGPSALMAVAGRIDPTRTTGLSVFTVRWRKYAVSSSVLVPCVTTKPATAGILGDDLVDPFRQRQPMGDGDVGAVDVGDLLDPDVGQLRDLRHRLHQLLAEDRSGLVVREVGGRGAGSGDRAAGGENPDRRQGRLGLRRRGDAQEDEQEQQGAAHRCHGVLEGIAGRLHQPAAWPSLR